ncbi:hypothetical protein TNCV_4109161 [Trichonephila clavipes]|nr:hypothetical protein TNCV_4109161 [Trichonephila clavipes]
MSLTQDGVPVHFLIFPCATYRGRWIGGSGPVVLPPCFPDLNPLDFFFWIHLNRLRMRRRWLQGRISRHGSSSLRPTPPAHQICLKASDNASSVGVGCVMIYVVTTSRNFCYNHLSLYF